jgi:hypothetical protein
MSTAPSRNPSFFSHDPSRPRLTDRLVIETRLFPITWEQGALMYLLMRGGIEDPGTLASATAIDFAIVADLPLNEIFVWFDNELSQFRLGRRKMPLVSHGSRVFCQSCGTRVTMVPCECEAPPHYDVTPPDRQSLRVGKAFGNDRHWSNVGRISASEHAYHGDPLTGAF